MRTGMSNFTFQENFNNLILFNRRSSYNRDRYVSPNMIEFIQLVEKFVKLRFSGDDTHGKFKYQADRDALRDAVR